jgi:WS/DGAT/MGAT family acyltransferase
MGRRMTSLDAAFYNLERTGQLLHVGGVYIAEGPLDFERQVADLSARLHLVPRYLERAVPVPLGLSHPTWEPDPRFDVRHHVKRHVLRAPADEGALAALVSRLFAQPLDRRRPLWEMHHIDGYLGDRSALFWKVHHCMIDGVSGVQLAGVLCDVTPTPPEISPPPATRETPPVPPPSLRVLRAVEEGIQGTVTRARGLWQLVRHPGRGLRQLADAADALSEIGRVALTSPPPTPFNGHVSTLRRVVWTTISLAEVKAVKNRLGGTVNDVVLTGISAALRRYLEDKGLNPDRLELRAMLPVNVRRPDEHLELGNRVSMLVAPLPVGIFDPLERMRQVRAATAQLKERGQAARMTRALELLELLPPVMQKPLAWLQVQGVPINTVCTNVPGPAVRLYAQGQRLETMVPVVPLAQGVGIVFAILSYADTLTIGITADPALVPDADRLSQLVHEGVEELRTLAGVEPAPSRAAPLRPERQRRLTPAPSQVA